MARDQRRLAAIILADVAGYSRLMGHDESGTLAALKAHRRELIDPKISEYGGRIVKTTGDGLLLEFPSVVDAVRCAVEVQRGMRERNAGVPPNTQIQFRIGINVGDIIIDGEDIYGDGVNVAARLQTLAEPGGICVSKVVRDQVIDKLSFSFENLGRQQVKNIARPLEVYRIRDAPLPSSTVGPQPMADFRHAVAETPTRKDNLPQPLTSLIGREGDLDEYSHLLAQTRLLTLTGVGGCGKTRLAIELGRRSAPSFPDGVWFVDLAPMYDPERVPLSVATTLGIHEQPGKPIVETLCEQLSGDRILLVLDNCEHLVAACAVLVERLLTAASGLRILATSREALSVPGEQGVTVRSLAFAPAGASADVEALGTFAAIRLFVARAKLVMPGFILDATTGPAVAEICRRLDGIPLAIELAAARAKVLSVDEIRSKLDDRFRLLTGGSKTALARHQTLRAAVQWSYDLLMPDEQRLVRQLAVFAGGWTLDAAVAVAGDGQDTYGVLDQLARLVDKSLTTSQRVKDGATRYSMLETVRQYAQECLEGSGEADAARERHLQFFVALAEQAEPELMRSEQKLWSALLARDLENLLVALAWCDRSRNGAEQGLRLVAALRRFWLPFRLLELGLRVTMEALGRQSAERDTSVRARGLHTASQFALYVGRFREARQYCAESLAIARALGDARMTAHALITLGTLDDELGDRASGLRWIEEALPLVRSLGDAPGLSVALNALGEIHRRAGDLASAQAFYEECLVVDREQGDTLRMAFVLLNLARTFIPRGGNERARPILLEALDAASSAGSKWTLQASLDTTAGLAAAMGDWMFAARMFGAAEAERVALGYHRVRVDEDFLAPLAARTREALSEDAYGAAYEGGRALTVEQAVAEARAWLENGKRELE